MAKSTANFGRYIISIQDDGSVIANIDGEIAENTKKALRTIASECGFEYDEKWNTRQFGKNLIEFLNFKIEILEVMRLIAEDINSEKSKDIFTYNQQRAMINRIFQMKEYDKGAIMLRLTVIDSLYSTNAAYSYFSIEDMAEKILALKTQDKAKSHFDSLVSLNMDTNLFSGKYGIRKNLAEGSKQPSLMSKYAYYQLLQDPQNYPLGFPIYDSLAIKMYPVVCKAIGITPESKSNITISANADSPNICHYIEALNKLRIALFNGNCLFYDMQQFDILDAYLWRMGKIDEGNFSLLLSREDYTQFIKNLGLKESAETIYNKYQSQPDLQSKKDGKTKYSILR